MVVTQFLGIQSLPDVANKLFKKFALLSVVRYFLGNLSSTFFILYAVDRIGFELAGIVLSIQLLVQLILDYPSGSLGDYIGQKWVMAISFFISTIFFYLLSIATSFDMFVVLAIVGGIADAQSSGTLESWFDSNYQRSVNSEDSERKIYGFGLSRISTLTRIFMALAFIIGGYVATTYNRESVFLLQAILCIIFAILALLLMNDVYSEKIEEQRKSLTQYFSVFIGGIKFLIESKTSFFFLLGIALINVCFTIWWQLLLFPIYFGYSGSDSIASIFRTIIFFIGIPIGFYMAKVSIKIATEKVSTFYLLGIIFYNLSFITLLTLLPPEDSLNIAGLTITAIILTVANTGLLDIAGTLQGRTMVDLVPSENRNSVYSLIPSLVSILGIPLLPITGSLIKNWGLNVGIIVPFLVGLLGTLFMILSFYFRPKKTLN